VPIFQARTRSLKTDRLFDVVRHAGRQRIIREEQLLNASKHRREDIVAVTS